MNIDLSIINFTGELATSYNIRYARFDNTSTPVYTSAGNKTAGQFPVNISNIANGQYIVGITPVYSDLRVCSETTQTTPACQPIIALNASQSGSNIQVTYTASGDVPQVYLTVNYPNGGSFTGTYTNGANNSTILVPIPSGVNGNYNVYMQSVCDPDTGFYSTQSPPVIVVVGSNTVIIATDAPGATIISVNGISGYALSTSLTVGNSDTGTHNTFTGAISGRFTGTPFINCHAELQVNSTLIQCVNMPNTDGGSIAFASRTFYSTDVIRIDFTTGSCI